MKKEFFIQNRKIGIEHKPLIIAEIGINHGGSLKVAKEMVLSAKRRRRSSKTSNTHCGR